MLPGAKAIHLKVHKHPVPKTQTYTNPGEIFTFPTIYVHTVICETNQPFSFGCCKKKERSGNFEKAQFERVSLYQLIKPQVHVLHIPTCTINTFYIMYFR